MPVRDGALQRSAPATAKLRIVGALELRPGTLELRSRSLLLPLLPEYAELPNCPVVIAGFAGPLDSLAHLTYGRWR